MKTLEVLLNEEKDLESESESECLDFLSEEHFFNEDKEYPENLSSSYENKNLHSLDWKEQMKSYIKTQENPLLEIIIMNFHKDLISHLTWGEHIGLNTPALDFLKTLLKNQNNLNIDSLIQLLILLKTIKFHYELVPAYFYAQIDETIRALIDLIHTALKIPQNKQLKNLVLFLKIQIKLDRNVNKTIEILQEWISSITNQKLKEWKWTEFFFLFKSLKIYQIRNLTKNKYFYKDFLFDVAMRKFSLTKHEESLDSLCLIYESFMDYVTYFRLYTKNIGNLNHIMDLILEREGFISPKSAECLLQAIPIINVIYKEEEIFEKIEKSSIFWKLRSISLFCVLKIFASLIRLKTYINNSFLDKMTESLDNELMWRVKLGRLSFFHIFAEKYTKLMPLTKKNLRHYEIIYLKLKDVTINYLNFLNMIMILKVYREGDFPIDEILHNFIDFLTNDMSRIALKQKIIILKLLSLSTLKNHDIIEIYMVDIQSKISSLLNTKILLILAKEAFLWVNKSNSILARIRLFIVQKVKKIWRKISSLSAFLITFTRNHFPHEKELNLFVFQMISVIASEKYLHGYLSNFNCLFNTSENQIRFLKDVLINVKTEDLKRNKSLIFTILKDLSKQETFSIKRENNKDIAHIVNIMNDLEVLEEDNYSDPIWTKFKYYVSFLVFHNFPLEVPLKLILKKFIENIEIGKQLLSGGDSSLKKTNYFEIGILLVFLKQDAKYDKIIGRKALEDLAVCYIDFIDKEIQCFDDKEDNNNNMNFLIKSLEVGLLLFDNDIQRDQIKEKISFLFENVNYLGFHIIYLK